MIVILGDIHGYLSPLQWAHDLAVEKGAVALIQVGDFGFDDLWKTELEEEFEAKIPIYAIDGNHEHYPWMATNLMPNERGLSEFVKNVWHVRRGTTLMIDGKRIGFLGGAGSIDYKLSTLGYDWFLEEQISDSEADRLKRVGSVDLFVTHTPPQRMVEKYFGTIAKRLSARERFYVPFDYTDPSAIKVDEVWESLGYPRLICGHMHESIEDMNVTILDQHEIIFID